jgi:hypothetical protein
MKRKRAALRQLTFSACIQGLDLEPMLRGELLEAMASVLLRPSQAETPAHDIPLDLFEWPKVGPPIVHYPWGGHGPRIEHPPGIVCDECQWQRSEQGWPLPSCGREPQRVCAGCRRLRRRAQWHPAAEMCSDCTRGVLVAAGCWPSTGTADTGDTGAAP